MFEYTPKKEILREMQVSEQNYKLCAEYLLARQILQKYRVGTEYCLAMLLMQVFPKLKFRSPTKLKRVPVNGFLFPVNMFDEKII